VCVRGGAGLGVYSVLPNSGYLAQIEGKLTPKSGDILIVVLLSILEKLAENCGITKNSSIRAKYVKIKELK
jgi:hypothetical protein